MTPPETLEDIVQNAYEIFDSDVLNNGQEWDLMSLASAFGARSFIDTYFTEQKRKVCFKQFDLSPKLHFDGFSLETLHLNISRSEYDGYTLVFILFSMSTQGTPLDTKIIEQVTGANWLQITKSDKFLGMRPTHRMVVEYLGATAETLVLQQR